jgi:threonine/homoserine/homoserine lactone efflux protein
LTLAWLLVVVRAGALLRRTTVRRVVDAVTGFVLVGFGAGLAAARR